MTMQDYRDQVKEDILTFARECYDYNPHVTVDEIIDNAWTADTVTGNGSGSYTFSTWQARKNLTEDGLIWDDELLEMFEEWGDDHVPIEKGAEHIDVSIRCFFVREFEDDVRELLEELDDEANNKTA